MARTSTRYVCQKCGHEAIRWLGRCPDCGNWNSLTEEVVVAPTRGGTAAARAALDGGEAPARLVDVSLDAHPRLPAGLGEFDRVLGGGIVPGSLVLIGGDPGIGKCVTGDTRVLDPVTGDYLPIIAWKTQDRSVVAVDDCSLRLAPAATAAFHERGIRPIALLRTKLGRVLRCTPDHPVLTPEGWRPVSALTEGSAIACPRAIPYFGSEEMAPSAVKLMAYALSDGSAQSQISVTNCLPEVVRDLEEIAADFKMRLVIYQKRGNKACQYRFTIPWADRALARQELAHRLRTTRLAAGISWQEWARRAGVPYYALYRWRCAQGSPDEATLRRLAEAVGVSVAELAPEARDRAEHTTPIARFLRQVGIRYLKAADKAVPDCAFRLPREQVVLFLRTLFTCDGSVYVGVNGDVGVLYHTISRRLAEDVQHLLLRFGLVGRLRERWTQVNGRPYSSYEVALLGFRDAQRFLQQIGLLGREEACRRILAMQPPKLSSTHRDVIPTGPIFWAFLREAMDGATFASVSRQAGVKLKNRRHERPLCRATVAAVARVCPHPRLEALAEGDIYWDEVVSVSADSDALVYDLSVPGAENFVANDLIIHNSTLLAQVADQLALAHGKTLYVTGEESAQQVRMRADRLGVAAPELYLVAETEIDRVEAHAARLKPRFLVIDSIQTMHDAGIASAAATVSQVRQCTARLARLAKGSHTAVFIVGHVTKEGTIAGPRVLEHMVDTVLYFEGDRFQSHRLLRAVKNRFGSTDELGIFEMGEAGLTEVENASERLLSERPAQGAGSVVVPVIEGTRPLLVEVQALVARSFLTSPRRMTTGVDYNRACMILAVLERRVGLRMADKDVYVNVAGGLKLTEPAVDLGIAVALASSYRDRAVDPELVVAGEVGLAGEVRAVQQLEKRLKEASRLGFRQALVARAPRRPPGPSPLATEEVATVAQAIEKALVPGAGDDFG
jgi:DNA repair protein RadA/Sms